MRIRKLLYLLQLEEYQTERYFAWLKKNTLEKLEERKNKLRLTGRIVLTTLTSFVFLPLLGEVKAVGYANILLSYLFNFFEEIIVWLAKIKLKFFPSLVKIVITGSYGKTTFKELLSFVLESKYSVLKTPENINTRIGIALLILKKLNSHHQVVVIEAAAYQAGDIKKICQLIQPSFGIITIFGLMHLERFKTASSIKKAKSEIIPFIKNKENLFLPKKFHQFIDFQKTVSTISQKLGIPPSLVKKRLKNFKTPLHRLTEKKINAKIIILDDTYNSNPLGFQKALKKLKSYRDYQKIIVTPGMIEFGKKQYSLNYKLANLAAKIVDIFVIIGETNKRALLNGAKKEKRNNLKIILCKKDEAWEKTVSSLLRPPTVVLLENELPDHYF